MMASLVFCFFCLGAHNLTTRNGGVLSGLKQKVQNMTIDVNKQVKYWIDGSGESMKTVPVLEREGFYPEALFWMHLAIEKAFKAHVVLATKAIPPLIHNLVWLAERAGLELTLEQTELCNELNKWQGIARYGAGRQREIEHEQGRILLKQAMELKAWLIQKLQK
jgi:HEPN domain-containing protein